MTNRFNDYTTEVRELVLDFEEMLKRGEQHFFDVDQLEIIIDFYLETSDLEMLSRAVSYAEKLFPASNEIRLRRSHQLCANERYDEALTILQQLQQLEPDNTDVFYALGSVYSVKGQPRKAIQYYQKASGDGCELGMVYGNIADEYVRMNRNFEAIAYYKKALEVSPDEERSLYNLANCYEQEMQDEPAVAFYSSFVEANPYSKVAWYCLGGAYKNLKLFEKAIDAFEYATTIDKKFVDAYIQKALCYQMIPNFPQAVASLREALPYSDDTASLNQQIGLIYMYQQNYVTAIIYYKEALQEDPSDCDTLMSIALCYAMMNEKQEAFEYLNSARKLNSQEPLFLEQSARIFARFGNNETAELLFRQALGLVKDNDAYWIDYAKFLIDLQRYDDAIDVLQEGIVNSTEPFIFNEYLAWCYFITGRRNFLFNALRACVDENKEWALEMLESYPAMCEDIEVVNILHSN